MSNREQKRPGLLAVVALAIPALILGMSAWAAAQAPRALGAFEVQYFDESGIAGGNRGEYLNIFNPQVEGPSDLGTVCEMIYVYDAHEEMEECCGCPTSNFGVRSINVPINLTSNPLGGPPLRTGVIKIVTTDINSPGSGTRFPFCNPALLNTGTDIELPSPAWTTHGTQISGVILGTEDHFKPAPLFDAEINALASNCAGIHVVGSGHGICTCGIGDSFAPVPNAGGRR